MNTKKASFDRPQSGTVQRGHPAQRGHRTLQRERGSHRHAQEAPASGLSSGQQSSDCLQDEHRETAGALSASIHGRMFSES